MNQYSSKITAICEKMTENQVMLFNDILLKEGVNYGEIATSANIYLARLGFTDELNRRNVERWRKNRKNGFIEEMAPEDTVAAQDSTKLSIDEISGTASFEASVPGDINLTGGQVLGVLGLDANEWEILALEISSGSQWVREHQGEKAVTRQVRKYKGRVARKENSIASIAPASKVKVKVSKTQYKVNTLSDWESIFVFPDQQIGYRNDCDMTIHDERAISVAHNILEAVKPTHVVNLGDFLDLAPLGRYVVEPGLIKTTQAAIDRGSQELAYQREVVKDGDIVLIKGNHDKRFEDALIRAIPEVHGLRLANSTQVALSLDHLMRFDEFGITYIDAYPGEHGDGAYWANTGTLKFQHAPVKLNSGGSSAVGQSKDGAFSTIYGHCHRIEVHYNNAKLPNGGSASVFAASPGTLASTRGQVPGYATSLNKSGVPQDAYTNWQQAIAIVHYKPGVPYSERLDIVEIKDYSAIWHGMEFCG